VGNVYTDPPGCIVFTVTAALAQMEPEIKRERINDSVSRRRAAGKNLGGRRQRFTDSQISNARRLIAAAQPATQVARDPGMSRATRYRSFSCSIRFSSPKYAGTGLLDTFSSAMASRTCLSTVSPGEPG
jgi:DNA invertase Pin-like site-specific DNA recombinase